MTALDPIRENSSSSEVTVSSWQACLNRTDNMLVVSCTVTTTDSNAGISGVGMILNTKDGVTVASFYTELSGGNASASPALNLEPGQFASGDSVWAVAQGECEGQHFFFEQELTISDC